MSELVPSIDRRQGAREGKRRAQSVLRRSIGPCDLRQSDEIVVVRCNCLRAGGRYSVQYSPQCRRDDTAVRAVGQSAARRSRATAARKGGGWMSTDPCCGFLFFLFPVTKWTEIGWRAREPRLHSAPSPARFGGGTAGQWRPDPRKGGGYRAISRQKGPYAGPRS